MRDVRRQNSVKDWVRVAAKLGLLFTEPNVRKAVSDRVRDTVEDLSGRVSSKYDEVSDTVSSKYEDAVDRMEAAADALRGDSKWPSHLTGFLLGLGIGAGLGILLAPASGRETRESVRDKVGDLKDRVFESAASATGRFRPSVTSMPSTGTGV